MSIQRCESKPGLAMTYLLEFAQSLLGSLEEGGTSEWCRVEYVHRGDEWHTMRPSRATAVRSKKCIECLFVGKKPQRINHVA